MQRLNKNTHAPVGTAFFLFLALAILPASLRVAGVQVSFSPRLSAAVDAWQQITEVFGASYQPGTNAGLAVVREPESIPSEPLYSCSAQTPRLACGRALEGPNRTEEISEPSAAKAVSVRRMFPRTAPRPPLSRKQLPSFVVASSGMKFRAMVASNALKLETNAREELLRNHEELLKSIKDQLSEEGVPPFVEIKNLPTSKSLRMLVRIKRPAAVSPAKAAECKGFTAMALERRRQCDRAALTSLPATSQDNSEF
jgi:hypothetical protein